MSQIFSQKLRRTYNLDFIFHPAYQIQIFKKELQIKVQKMLSFKLRNIFIFFLNTFWFLISF